MSPAQVYRQVGRVLNRAHVSAKIELTDGAVYVITDAPEVARDLLGLARFRDQIGGVEITIV